MADPTVTNEQVIGALTKLVHGAVGNGDLNDRVPACWHDLRDDKLVIEVMDLDMYAAVTRIVNTATDETQCRHLSFAADMTALPDQGLEFDDFTLIGDYDVARPGTKFKNKWRWGVMNYRRDPLTIREIDWDNPVWKTAGWGIIQTYGPPFFVRKRMGTDMPFGE